MDLAIEVVFEDMEVKKKVFKALDEICPPDTFLATNTSALPIAVMASATKRPSMEHFKDKMLDRILTKKSGGNDLKRAVVFLTSKALDYVTGHILCVDGGLMAW